MKKILSILFYAILIAAIFPDPYLWFFDEIIGLTILTILVTYKFNKYNKNKDGYNYAYQDV